MFFLLAPNSACSVIEQQFQAATTVSHTLRFVSVRLFSGRLRRPCYRIAFASSCLFDELDEYVSRGRLEEVA